MLTKFFRVGLLLLVAAVLIIAPGCDTPADDTPEEDAMADEVASDAVAELRPGETVADLTPEQKYPGAPGATGIFMEEPANFFDQPFPCDTRRRSNGSPDIQDFPNPYGLALLNQYIEEAMASLDGFANNGAVYFRFDSPLNRLLLPSVFATTNTEAAAFIVNVTEESDFYGEFVPAEFWVFDADVPSPEYYVQPNVLAVRPLGGFPMRPGQQYACVVTRRLRDAVGNHLSPTSLVAAALSGDSSAPLYNLFGSLRSWLDSVDGIHAHDVAIATVFTVQDPVKELADAAKWLRENFTVELASPVEKQPNANDYDLYVGKYIAPNFQTGEPPYETDGEIVVNASGEPTVQWLEEMTVAIALPQGKPMPPGGWPLVMYSHGTGGSYKTFLKSVAEDFALQGIAGMSINQPLHGDRYTGPPVDVELYSFNFMNPLAARSLFRQAALDFVSLAMFAEEFKFSASGTTVSFNKDKIAYMGHSQGGLTGALYLAVDNSSKAAVLSGAGGGLAYTILLRKELDSGTNVDIKETLEAVLNLADGDELNLFHPAITLAQTLVEATDPINYSPFYFYPRMRQDPLNLLITEGVEDPYTPAVTTENLAVAGLVPPIAPVVHAHLGFDLAGLAALDSPVQGNMVLADGTVATAGVVQFNGYGHFVAFDNPTCRKMWLSLITSSLLQDQPTILK